MQALLLALSLVPLLGRDNRKLLHVSCQSHNQGAPEPHVQFQIQQIGTNGRSTQALMFHPTKRVYLFPKTPNTSIRKLLPSLKSYLALALLPSGVTKNYVRYMKWRLLQRFCKSVLHVLGTTSLLIGLGISSNAKSLTAASTSHWILKDIFGKAVRVVWASCMGASFDEDAKRWRFRASLIFMVGSALEMTCRLSPTNFLLLASLAKACQQVSMLTTTSTRTVFYQALSESNNNMGDVTAKGEAQIAIISVLGLFAGIATCKVVEKNLAAVVGVYVVLQAFELVCAYQQLRAVEFKTVNMERLQILVRDFVTTGRVVSTPSEMAQTERIFLPPRCLPFKSIVGPRLEPGALANQLSQFDNEDFAVVDGDYRFILLRPKADNFIVAKSLLTNELLRTHDQSKNMGLVLEKANNTFPFLLDAIREAGWDLCESLIGPELVRTSWFLPVGSTHSANESIERKPENYE